MIIFTSSMHGLYHLKLDFLLSPRVSPHFQPIFHTYIRCIPKRHEETDVDEEAVAIFNERGWILFATSEHER